MVDVDTFLTALYVMVDDFCHSRSQTEQHPGPDASLSPSEVITLAVFSRWSRFGSERDFYRYASSRLRDAFPTLPHRSQFNRSVRNHLDLIEEVALHLAKVMKAQRYPYEALDSSAMPIRDAKRRGEGWLAGFADIGWSNSLGWYEGFRLLVATDPTGVITGFGFCAASATDQQVALRPSSLCGIDRTLGYRAWDQRPWDPTLPTRALRAKKTIGAGWNATGCASHPPAQAQSSRKRSWPKRLRRWVAGIRQIVESVYDKLFNAFGLWRERPHELSGLRARLAARVALHNFCIWLNEQLGRPRLAFADLLGW